MPRFNRSRRRRLSAMRGGSLTSRPCILFEDEKYTREEFIQLCKARFNHFPFRDDLEEWLKFTKAINFFSCHDANAQNLITSEELEHHRDWNYFLQSGNSVGFYFDGANNTVLLYKPETRAQRTMRHRIMRLSRNQNMTIAEARSHQQ